MTLSVETIVAQVSFSCKLAGTRTLHITPQKRLLQDLCVRITSPDSLIQLVNQIHQEESNAKKAVRELKVHEAMKQAEKVCLINTLLS